MESDWYELLEIEEDENFIADIIDEITDLALDEVAEKIVKSRVLPHTVLAARELLLDVIEWEFLRSDPGEVGTNDKLSWIEDDEPSISVIDNWAQGAVRVERTVASASSSRPSTGSPLQSVVEEEEAEESLPPSGRCSSGVVSTDHELTLDVSLDAMTNHCGDDNDNDNSNNNNDDSCLAVDIEIKETNTSEEKNGTKASSGKKISSNKTHTSNKQTKKKSKKYRPHVGQLPVFEKISLESVTDLRPKPGTRHAERGGGVDDLSEMQLSSELLVRNQYGRASGPKEVIYDEKGKVVKVEKLNVAHFPSHRVPVKYSVVDEETLPDKKSTFHKRPSTKTKQDLLKKGGDQLKQTARINAKTLLQHIHPPTVSSWNTLTSSTLGNNNNNNNNIVGFNGLQPRSPLPPLMVDSMNVTDGVTIREGGLSKQVIKKSTLDGHVEDRSIYPISDTSARVLNVQDIVSENSPNFRYITA